MTEERRNYDRRAETLRAIADWLTRIDGGVTLDRLAELHHTLPLSTAERIVKRLAIRGLVRQLCAGAWIAAPPLRHPAEIVVSTD